MRQLFAFLLLAISVGAAQIGPDQPYMLVFRGPVCPSPFTYSAVPASSFAVGQSWQTCPEQVQIEYFPSLEKAVQRMNSRVYWYIGNPSEGQTVPDLKGDHLIGLFKVERIPVAIQSTGKKQKVWRQVSQEFEDDVMEWKVQP